MPYSEGGVDQLYKVLYLLESKRIALADTYLSYPFAHPRAAEHASHGFGRRISLLATAARKVFEFLPPESVEIPSDQTRNSAELSLQAFILNVFGGIDNLAWVWFYETRLCDVTPRIRDVQVGLGPRCVRLRQSFGSDFQTYLEGLNDWFEGMQGYRHALAHRIPLYIPPYTVPDRNRAAYDEVTQKIWTAKRERNHHEMERLRAKQMSLATFSPIMMHSFEENATPIFFHSQLLADFLTVEEIAQKMLAELKGRAAELLAGDRKQ
ncbi:MAG: hypothetical protein WCF20_13625 [Methylovirgula sp.]